MKKLIKQSFNEFVNDNLRGINESLTDENHQGTSVSCLNAELIILYVQVVVMKLPMTVTNLALWNIK